MKNRAFTLIESLIAIGIIIVLVSILTPVFNAVRRRGQIISSVSKLHQLDLGLELYRVNYSPVESYDLPKSYYSLALPRWRHWTPATFGVNDAFMESACGDDPTIHMTNDLTQIPGWISYAAPFYDPEILLTGNSRWLHYLSEYRENAVMFLDPFCNPAGTQMRKGQIRKRGLSVTLSGQLLNQYKTGDITDLRWYSDRPE
jgi:hypothetical protein